MNNIIIGYFSFLLDHITYLTIFLLMTIESSFIPFPSEIILIPAGILASSGKLNIYLIILFAGLGSITGAYINYYIALLLGRPFIIKYKKYFFIKDKHLKIFENFFDKYSFITTFNGRLLPGVRQVISFPAGFTRMNLLKFTIATLLGASIWNTILTLLGYALKENSELIAKYKLEISILIVLFIIITTTIYIYYKKRKKYGTNNKS